MNFNRSKKIITGITATALLIAAGVTTAYAEEEMPTADASVGLYSKYIWRGWELSNDTLVIQPSLSVSYKGFGANLWANLNASDEDTITGYDSNLWTETDFTLSYDGSYEKLGYGFGWIYYSLNSVGDTQEYYATVSYDTFLSPSLTIYYDTDALAGDWYANFSIGHSFALTEALSLDLGLAIGYYSIDAMNSPTGVDYDEFHDGILSASMSFPVGKYITITPELYWSFPLTSEAEDFYVATNIDGDGDDDYVYGGVSASFSF